VFKALTTDVLAGLLIHGNPRRCIDAGFLFLAAAPHRAAKNLPPLTLLAASPAGGLARGSTDCLARPGRRRSWGEHSDMTFLNAYFSAIDVIAIVAVVLLVFVAFFRTENVWLGLLLLVAVLWAGSSIFGLY